MKTNAKALLLLALATTLGAACSSQSDPNPIPVSPPASSAAPSVSAPTFGADAAPPRRQDAGTRCSYPLTQTEACGKCGQHSRSCLSSGDWGPWGSCDGQHVAQGPIELCDVGSTRTAPCGNCGTLAYTCDPTSCQWAKGVCQNEGCKPGDTQSTQGSCPSGQSQFRQCSAECTWGDYSGCGVGWYPMPSAPIGGRTHHVAVWTGTEMIVWGGFAQPETSWNTLVDGAAYNPTTNTWRTLPPVPSAYSQGNQGASAVWTGSLMIIWGGADNKGDGLIYDPAANSWRLTSIPTGMTRARQDHVAVWSSTTGEMLVWGGKIFFQNRDSTLNDGLAYNPTTDTWSPIPAAPIYGRERATAFWTGTEMLVWGGMTETNYFGGAVYTLPLDGARYDPKQRGWTTIAAFPTAAETGSGLSGASAFNGTDLFVWGGAVDPSGGVVRGGARYTNGGSWTRFSLPPPGAFAGLPWPASRFASWFGGGKFWIWSGLTPGFPRQAAKAGISYDPVHDTWATMPTKDAPVPAYGASAVWTGTRAIVWGGETSGNVVTAAGGLFQP